MNIFRKAKALALSGVVALGSAVSAFAEGAAGSIDTTVASTAMSDMATAVKGFINTCVPYIVGLLGVALVATLVWVAYKWIKKGANKAG